MASEVKTTARPASQETRPIFVPRTDIYETPDRVVLVAEMPGVAPDGLEITLERRVLTIRGRTGVPAREGLRRVYAEYGEGDYERMFTLSDEIDQDHIDAALRNGLLELTLHKAERAKPRRIEVRAT